MKYYIIAGEASGDMHASNLVAEIKKKDKKAEFRGCGGDLMKAQGVDLLKHYRTMAYMGFVEVAVNLRKVLDNIAQCKKDIVDYQPDVVILVDGNAAVCVRFRSRWIKCWLSCLSRKNSTSVTAWM